MTDFANATWLDACVLGVGILCLLLTSLNCGEAVGEAWRARGTADVWVRHVARQEVWQGMGMVALALLTVGYGAIVVALPPFHPAFEIAPIAFVADVLIMVKAFVIMAMAANEWWSRHCKPGRGGGCD